jgi:hypothetical protein
MGWTYCLGHPVNRHVTVLSCDCCDRCPQCEDFQLTALSDRQGHLPTYVVCPKCLGKYGPEILKERDPWGPVSVLVGRPRNPDEVYAKVEKVRGQPLPLPL